MNPKIEETSMVKDKKSFMFQETCESSYLEPMCTCTKNTVWNHQTKVIFQIFENDISEQSGDTSELRSFLPPRVFVAPKEKLNIWLVKESGVPFHERALACL